MMINILKLNAELDKMIAEQDAEVKSMNDAVLTERRARHDEMIRDLSEMYNALEQIGDEVVVETEIESPYGSPRDMYYFRLKSTYGREFGVFSGEATYLGSFAFNSSYDGKKRCIDRSSGLKADIAKIVDEWAGQRDVFLHRFEEECVKLIKKKAAKANERYEAAKKEYEEVCG